jgi:hypothetical protein
LVFFDGRSLTWVIACASGREAGMGSVHELVCGGGGGGGGGVLGFEVAGVVRKFGGRLPREAPDRRL